MVKRHGSVEIEITPQMVQSGLEALIEFRNEGDLLLVREIVSAALRQRWAALKSKSPAHIYRYFTETSSAVIPLIRGRRL